MDNITVSYIGNRVYWGDYIVYENGNDVGLGLVRYSLLGDVKPYGAMGLVIPGEDRKYFGWHETMDQAVAAVVAGV